MECDKELWDVIDHDTTEILQLLDCQAYKHKKKQVLKDNHWSLVMQTMVSVYAAVIRAYIFNNTGINLYECESKERINITKGLIDKILNELLEKMEEVPEEVCDFTHTAILSTHLH